MAVKENVIETYFCCRVRETGGQQRKARWIGRRACPDRLAWWPGANAWVELKRPDGEAREEQAREHERMRAGGMLVFVLDTKEAVDDFVDAMVRRSHNARSI